jgi:hypothetical protein
MQLKAAQIILSCRNIRRAEKGRQRGVWLLDHFVGTQEDGSRDGQGERLGNIEVPAQVRTCWAAAPASRSFWHH